MSKTAERRLLRHGRPRESIRIEALAAPETLIKKERRKIGRVAVEVFLELSVLFAPKIDDTKPAGGGALKCMGFYTFLEQLLKLIMYVKIMNVAMQSYNTLIDVTFAINLGSFWDAPENLPH